MKPLLASIISLALLLGGAGLTGTVGAQSGSGDTIGFGMDADSIRDQTSAGAKPDYGVMWIGPWTLSSGWGGPGDRMDQMRAQGVTPVIHFYYWGDDISPSCVENGCWSSLHNTWKDQDGWQRLAKQLVDNLHKHMGGEEVIVVMETEFNKASLQDYKPFDKMLRDKTNYIKWNYNGAEMVLGLGNWRTDAWDVWTAAAAANDQIGIQAMRGSTKDSLSAYNSIYEATLAGAKKANSLFGKPVFITDVALSSYPEPEYREHQAKNLKKFFDGMDELKRAGVTAMVYRTWLDQPDKNLGNYYGQAERHWGMAWANGGWKPAASVWVDGVKAERSGSSSGSGSGSSSGGYTTSFSPASGSNEWWIDVNVGGNPARVDVKINDGSWTRLDKTSWGTWAKSLHAPEGSDVRFRATNSAGDRAYSETFSWLKGTSSGSGSSGFEASFKPASGSNEWWVDVNVGAKPEPTRVDVRVDGSSWIRLDKTSWGTWAKSINAPKGSSVEFRATSPDGERVRSETFTWLGGSSSGGSSYSAKFEPARGSNEWWVDVNVGANPEPRRVDARVNGGSWERLDKTSWGTWAKSMNAPAGSSVEFRATSPDGDRVRSEPFSWLGFDADFSVRDRGNNWWAEVDVRTDEKLHRVHACIGSDCKRLHETDWGTWARSFHIPSGSNVQFVATSTSGEKATSSTYKW